MFSRTIVARLSFEARAMSPARDFGCWGAMERKRKREFCRFSLVPSDDIFQSIGRIPKGTEVAPRAESETGKTWLDFRHIWDGMRRAIRYAGGRRCPGARGGSQPKCRLTGELLSSCTDEGEPERRIADFCRLMALGGAV